MHIQGVQTFVPKAGEWLFTVYSVLVRIYRKTNSDLILNGKFSIKSRKESSNTFISLFLSFASCFSKQCEKTCSTFPNQHIPFNSNEISPKGFNHGVYAFCTSWTENQHHRRSQNPSEHYSCQKSARRRIITQSSFFYSLGHWLNPVHKGHHKHNHKYERGTARD